MYSCTSIEACIQAIMLESAKAGNDADSLLGQADGVEVGNLVGFLTLLYTIGRMVVRTY